MSQPPTIDLHEELRWRGLLHQCTDEPALREHLSTGPRSIYAGFDPTAPSLTIGNLVPIMVLRHVQRAGHRPVVVMGGGTGLIGDPSGKSAERTLMTPDTVRDHILAQRPIFDALLGADATVRNNADWLGAISFLDALRDIGKHFSVNMMMQKDSVRSRLEIREQGISYTEFSYMILQAYDFQHLHANEGVTVQAGGSDQFGNIVAGVDLIRRVAAAHQQPAPEAFGITSPLVTKADGGKFGKTEAGAVWLTRDRTSPYAYFQFWLNTADADVGRFLRIFTQLDRPAIEALEAQSAADPGSRLAQRTLAREATTLLYGADEALAAERAAGALFSGQIRELPLEMLREVLAEAPSSEHRADVLDTGVELVELLVETALAKSKREAREFIAAGSVSINGDKADEGRKLTRDDLLHGELIALRRGKKLWHLTRWC